MTLAAVTLDCADPLQLGAFYAEATGLALDGGSDSDFAASVAPADSSSASSV